MDREIPKEVRQKERTEYTKQTEFTEYAGRTGWS